MNGIISSCTIVCHGNTTNYELVQTDGFQHQL